MNQKRMYQEFLQLVTTDSPSGKESAVASILEKALTELGFTVSRDHAGDLFHGECGNVFGCLDGSLDGSILLCSHMDRVPGGIGIHPAERDGILYSDGTTILAADDISGVCAILEGIRQVLSMSVPLPRLEVLFTVGEESGLWGAKGADMELIQSKIAYMFDSPGPVGRLNTAAPGMYRLGCEIHGKAAHAGNEPEKGINAAQVMCRILASIPQGRLDFETTANFPILSTKTTARNIVCDYASFSGEARSRSLSKLEAYVADFEKQCQETAASAGADIKLEKICEFLPFAIPESHLCVANAKKAIEALHIPCLIEQGGGGMDANIFNTRGITSIGVASGYTKNHTFQEQLVLDDFYKSGDLAAQLILCYAEGLAH